MSSIIFTPDDTYIPSVIIPKKTDEQDEHNGDFDKSISTTALPYTYDSDDEEMNTRKNEESLESIINNNLKSSDCCLSLNQQTHVYKLIKTAGIISSVNKDFEDGMRNKKPVYVTIPKIVRKLYNIFILNADGVITTEDLFDYIKFILICIVDSPLVPVGEFGKDILEEIIDHSIDLLKIQIPVIQEEFFEEVERCKSTMCFKRFFCCFVKKVKKTKSTNRLSKCLTL
jgi:Ca2+-binding EF-hand superfamily protein